MQTILEGKQIVLGVSGGIAAYKSVELLRELTRQGARVRVVLTRNAQAFVGWMTFEALSGQPTFSDLFDKGSDASIKHIDWAREADLVVIAPATANIIGKLANGIADDALSTFMMAVAAPICLSPAMNSQMYASPAVQRNLQTLADWGYHIIEPTAGQLACGTVGPGRLPEPVDIADRICHRLTPKDFNGIRLLVTAGPTREAIDPVRYITNPSSGKMGYAVAKAAEYRGAHVTLVTGPSHLPHPRNVDVTEVVTAEEMAQAVFDHAERQHIVVKAAAVGDYRPKTVTDAKIKKNREEWALPLVKTVDILKTLGSRPSDRLLVGFAAETGDLAKNATAKLTEKNLDLIVANTIGAPGSGFDADTNQVTLFFKNGDSEPLPVMEKQTLANVLLDRILTHWPEKMASFVKNPN